MLFRQIARTNVCSLHSMCTETAHVQKRCTCCANCTRSNNSIRFGQINVRSTLLLSYHSLSKYLDFILRNNNHNGGPLIERHAAAMPVARWTAYKAICCQLQRSIVQNDRARSSSSFISRQNLKKWRHGGETDRMISIRQSFNPSLSFLIYSQYLKLDHIPFSLLSFGYRCTL